MFNKSRGIIFLALITLCLTCGCSAGTDSISSVVVISDVHFNPYYDTSLFPRLLAADASEWEGIFETSPLRDPATWGSDTNYPIFKLALQSMRQNLRTSRLVINTGDFISHHFAETFYEQYGSEDQTAMKAFTLKTMKFFVGQVRAYAGGVPVMFVLGNNDSYEGDYKIAPNSQFLSDTAELFYTDSLNGMADHQAFLASFQAGGYYAAEPLGTGMVVIGLNTVFMSTRAESGIEAAISTELSWLESTLASARTSGKKVWLLLHVPPGADIHATGGQVDERGQLTTATMHMQSNYQASLLQILANYSDIIKLELAGHTHMDEYRIVSSDPLEITPSISPRSGNNPAFKIITYKNASFEPTNYASWYYDLSTNPTEFHNSYIFSTSYSTQGYLDAALQNLFPALATNTTKQTMYQNSYYSGHNASNPITSTNWPVYWCGIGKMVQQDLIDCVNAY